MVRLLELEVLSCPHLMLADLGGNKRFAAARGFEQLFHRVLRLDDAARIAFLGVAQRIFAPPHVDLLPPLRQGRAVLLRGAVREDNAGADVRAGERPVWPRREPAASERGECRHALLQLLEDAGRVELVARCGRILRKRLAHQRPRHEHG